MGTGYYIPKPFDETELLNAVENRPAYYRRHSYRIAYQHIKRFQKRRLVDIKGRTITVLNEKKLTTMLN
jgi:DNA-binding response OmpR family regulator